MGYFFLIIGNILETITILFIGLSLVGHKANLKKSAIISIFPLMNTLLYNTMTKNFIPLWLNLLIFVIILLGSIKIAYRTRWLSTFISVGSGMLFFLIAETLVASVLIGVLDMNIGPVVEGSYEGLLLLVLNMLILWSVYALIRRLRFSILPKTNYYS